MSLNTAVSGIKAAQAGLNVTSNDLANANTTGFKSGTQRFADIYPSTPNSAGLGVSTGNIERSFQQGNTQTTSNPLDLAIQGNGYFVTNHHGTQQYTRDGNFQLNPSTNQIVNASGDSVLGFQGTNTSGQAGPLTVSRASQAATPTSQVKLSLNLNQGDSAIPSGSSFSASNPNTYNATTSVTAYDSLGNANNVNLYFRKQGGTATATTPAKWQVYAQPVNANGSTVGSASQLGSGLTFSSSGQLTGGSTPAPLTVNWGNGAGSSNINFNFQGTSLAAQKFAVNSTTNDGFPPGTYQGVKINNQGQVQTQYSNGQTKTVGTVAVANFVNQQGLNPASNNAFLATTTSGPANINAPGVGNAGKVQSGVLEQSNVDLSSKLVSLITDQQAYQANTKSISTDKQDTQRLLQI
ncbi:flagellar hook protein FlgE [Salinisphaera sp. RV14]|uniref:flagellar hook protein FlgE n=1 Tax=unclassified Salinisphaera TaxID=2649847 RepID=UPI003F8559B5